MTAEDIVAQVKDLPVVSETARKLTVQLGQPDLHRDELVKTLSRDSVLTAKVLRVCNSAEMGAREPITSIDQALLMLGDNAIFRMVSAVGFGDCLGLRAPGYDTEANGLWTHSLTAALGAEYPIAEESYGDFPVSTAFTAGLLHDIGKMVINRFLTPKTRASIRAAMTEESITRVAAEKAVLGANHSEVGACLLSRWALPEPIIEAVANHHSPVTAPVVQLSAVVYLANCAAHIGGQSFGWEARLAETSKVAANMLKMELAQAEKMVAGIQLAVQKLPSMEAAA